MYIIPRNDGLVRKLLSRLLHSYGLPAVIYSYNHFEKRNVDLAWVFFLFSSIKFRRFSETHSFSTARHYVSIQLRPDRVDKIVANNVNLFFRRKSDSPRRQFAGFPKPNRLSVFAVRFYIVSVINLIDKVKKFHTDLQSNRPWF